MIGSKLLPPIHIHPILIIFIIISFVTGTFMHLFVILIIVLIHELGHYSMAKFFKWRIKRVMLWIFGGVMETDEHGSRPVHEELLVTIAGPLQHVFIYFLLYLNSFNSVQLVSIPIVDMVLYYNTLILIFNLLPIWPLDGGKILFLILSKFTPFQKAYNMNIIISMIGSLFFLLIQILMYSFNLSAFLILMFLFMENRSEWKKRYYVFIRFLLNRYQGHSGLNNVRNISVPYYTPLMKVFSQFYKDEKHFIYVTYPNKRRQLLDENDCLHSYFYEKKVNVEIGDLKNDYLEEKFSTLDKKL